MSEKLVILNPGLIRLTLNTLNIEILLYVHYRIGIDRLVSLFTQPESVTVYRTRSASVSTKHTQANTVPNRMFFERYFSVLCDDRHHVEHEKYLLCHTSHVSLELVVRKV